MAMSRSRDPSELRPEATPRPHTPRFQSRSHGSRSVSVASRPFLQDPEVEAGALIDPDGPLASEMLHRERNTGESCVDQADGDPSDELDEAVEHRWWKRPSPWWFLSIMPFVSLARAATLAPRVEIYIRLACDAQNSDSLFGQIVHDQFSTPDRWKQCASDPTIQAAVAKLAIAIAASMGVLGCLTTAWWGSLSDRYGRTRVLSCAVAGQVIEDLSFLLVCKFSKFLPGGYWFLVFGPIISGLLGGMNTVSVGIHAYIADCTDANTRSRFFSLFLGLLFTGFSVGPTLGSILISYTEDPLSVFYMATCLHSFYALMICFVIPESLSRSQMAGFHRDHAVEAEDLRHARTKGGMLLWLGRLFGFLRPLSLLLPSRVGGRRNWSLLLLAAGYGCTIALKGDLTYEYQYMALTFGWNSEQLGYYTSALGATRALHLTVFLPLAIKLLQPKPPAVHLPVEADEPLTASRPPTPREEPTPPSSSSSLTAATPQPHSPTFDLALARFSILIEIFAYALMALAPNGYLFTAYAIISALGIGFSPAVNSVASALYTQNGGRELGKLFGALGVVQTVCSQVLGPFLFGVTYMKTVATAPKAIFAISLAALVTSFVFLAPIRLQRAPGGASGGDVEDRGPSGHVESAPVGERDSLVVGDGERRGRTAVKPYPTLVSR